MRCVRTTIVELDKIPGIGDTLPSFEIVGVKPGFHLQEEDGQSAFEALTEGSFPGKWKAIFFYPEDFTFVCPTEIAEFDAAGDGSHAAAP